ncbi:mannose-1-phosphate guanylyltransferase/mannose-6-phosphate isomerase [Avibacterium paragallinarum]|uniref:mannose-1-phosphate guanylyltransferase/mannose-6-phosphate isomerase n=1 Tax=Avibacterium paragallinarum TaxID=728 RepID=UPI002EDAEDAB
MFIPVIMAGGTGSRLWPLSRGDYPKQFLFLSSSKAPSMLQATIERLNNFTLNNIIIVTNEKYANLVIEQCETYDHKIEILLEPMAKNTAPALAISAFHALSLENDPILVILAADHFIGNNTGFNEAIEKAVKIAKKDYLVTFGILPTYPETGYGYIHKGKKLADGGYVVNKFVEKPDINTAKLYLDSNDYLWNSGCFVFKARAFLEELKAYQPDLYNLAQNIYSSNISTQHTQIQFERSLFEQFQSISIDYAIMEKTDKAVVVPMNAEWNDVGSWSSVWDISSKNEDNNCIKGDVITYNTKNSLIYSSNKLISVVGLDNLIIVDTQDSLLVANKDHSQDVKFIVNELDSKNRSEHISFKLDLYDRLKNQNDIIIETLSNNQEKTILIEKDISIYLFIGEGALHYKNNNEKINNKKLYFFNARDEIVIKSKGTLDIIKIG